MCVKKALILGIDGLAWDIVENFLNKNYLTILRDLKEKGITGSIETIPPSTPPMWTSITSGVNPGKHGLFGFVDYTPSGIKKGINNSTSIRHPRLHDYFSQNNLKSIIVNLPFSSWPRIPFKGSLISDWVSPKRYGYPEKTNELLKRNIEYYMEDETEELICKYITDDLINLSTMLDVMEADDFHYMYININFVDKAIHKVPTDLFSIEKKCFQKKLVQLNDSLKKLYNQVKDESIVIVVSDHGLQLVEKSISINKLLYEKGYIVKSYEEDEVYLERKMTSKEKIIIKIANTIVKTPFLSKFFVKIGKKLVSKDPNLIHLSKKVKRPRPDTEKSIAFMVPGVDGGIYINKQIVSEREYDTTLKNIMDVIASLEKNAKKQLFHGIYEKSILYKGPYAYKAPDITVVPERGYKFGLGLSGNLIEEIPITGTHYHYNMHIILSPEPYISDLAKKLTAPWDYAILILTALNLPVPHDTDSQILQYNLPNVLKKKNYNLRYDIARKIAMKNMR